MSELAKSTTRSRLFRRKATLRILVPVNRSLSRFGADVVEITDMRFEFKVKKTLAKSPNKSEIVVTNLSEQSRAALQGKGLRVTLSAGYEGTEAIVLVGDVRDCDSTQDGPRWVTKIQCGDGERGYRYGRVSEAFREGVGATAIVQKVAAQMGVDASGVRAVEALAGRQFVSGYSVHGRASRELDRLLRGFGLEWSVQDGRLQILTPDQSTQDPIVELDFSSGLVGSPTLNTPTGEVAKIDPFTGRVDTSRGRPTLKARSLLQPELRPGRRVTIDSITGIKGTFKITEVTHSGDSWSGEWYSDIEAVQA